MYFDALCMYKKTNIHIGLCIHMNLMKVRLYSKNNTNTNGTCYCVEVRSERVLALGGGNGVQLLLYRNYYCVIIVIL